jgi:hypothetical protein
MPTAADRCLLRLVAQIRPKRPNLGARTTAMFEQLRVNARSEGIELVGFAYAGSIEKGTGLRRYRDRERSIPGQAVDLVLELAPGEPPTHAIHLQLASIAERCFTAAGQADELDFRLDRLQWRLLPILAQRGPEGYVQRLLEPDGARVTSVRAHTLDVRARTRASIEQAPSVGFNDCVRLLKWWQAIHPCTPAVPSFALERLAIAAFDRVGVRDGYAATLAAWTDLLEVFDVRDLVDPASDGHHELLPAWSDPDRHALAQSFAAATKALREAAALDDELAAAELLATRMFGPVLNRARR